jgi:hypothetical protein
MKNDDSVLENYKPTVENKGPNIVEPETAARLNAIKFNVPKGVRKNGL